MLNLSVAGMLEKSQLSSDGVWLLLVEVEIPEVDEPLRLVRNNEDITWNGYTWTAFNFKLGDITEDNKGRPQSVPLQISNITQSVQAYVEANSGLTGQTVTLRVVHSQHLDNTSPELEEIFTVQSTTCDSKWVTFYLGCEISIQRRFPARRVLKSFCAWRDQYKGIECGYNGSMTECDGTLESCRNRGNSSRYGGEPSIPEGGLYA
ncbi:MAG: minor tail protein [Firmicutes bacterium]|nr:minor tail protein [Bacillota bacterium]